jgi:hypothetical protein
MKAMLRRIMWWLLAAVLATATAEAGAQSPAALYSPPQLDQLLAPIALYPDPLLGQILMASTYPLEVVEAARWRQAPENAALGGDALATALQDQDWAPSVKSLAAFPQVLQMMNANLGWTQELGDAFLAQQADVMDAVQRLRARAAATGNLGSNAQVYVSSDGTTTVIEPADSQIVYVPSYDPMLVYGVWPYPDYPPYMFAPWPGYVPPGGLIDFGFGITIIRPLWGWDDCDWRHHRIRIDHDRFNEIEEAGGHRVMRPRMTGNTWQHEPFHRRGVAYRDEGSRTRFLGNRGGAPEGRRAYRGFEGAPAIVAPSAPVLSPPLQVGRPPRNVGEPRDRNEARPRPQSAPPPAAVRMAPVPVPRRQPPVFGEIERGGNVRREAERGRASRESAAPVMRAPAPVYRPPPPPRSQPKGESRGDGGGRSGRRER